VHSPSSADVKPRPLQAICHIDLTDHQKLNI